MLQKEKCQTCKGINLKIIVKYILLPVNIINKIDTITGNNIYFLIIFGIYTFTV